MPPPDGGEVSPRGGESALEGDNINTPATTTADGTINCSATSRYRHRAPLGLHARGFREGFDAGAQSALRQIGRRCHCLDCAVEVEQLADYFAGAADRREAADD